MTDFATLFFDVSETLSEYRRGTEAHVIALRRVIQEYDHLAPHIYDGEGWSTYVSDYTGRSL